MQHLDPESISLAALNEPLDASSEEHLVACEECAGELHDLKSVVHVARGGTANDVLESPDPHVWAAIHNELGLQPSLRADPLTSSVPATTEGTLASTESQAAVADFDSHRRKRATFPTRYLVAAAVAGVVAGGGVVWAVQSTTTTTPQETVAQAELEPLENYSGEGSATVVTAGDGARTLEVTSTEEQADGFQEVWLIAPDLSQMYSLGVLSKGTASLTIPDSVDLAQFPIVDISAEPLDGDPTHSGVSLLRGNLEETSG